jgi:NhaP-type Na+/H+ or K+/H+ antiporter
MKEFNGLLALISLLVVVFGLYHRFIQKKAMTEPMLAMFSGILIGPYILNWFDPTSWENHSGFMVQACRLTIAMALMATALRLPGDFFNRNTRTMIIIIVLGMILMNLFSSIVFALFFNYSVVMAWLLGAIITPTDPVVSSTIVSGKTAQKLLPDRIRNVISGESGANDGLAFPLVLMPILLLQQKDKPFYDWFFKVVLWENVAAIIIAYIIGMLAGKLLEKNHQKDYLSSKSILAFTISLSLLILGSFALVEFNGIVGVFAAGIALNRHISKNDALEEEKVQEMTERLFTIPIFVFFGMSIPWDVIFKLGWITIPAAVAILLFRRLPAFFILKPALRAVPNRNDVLFLGWLGPIGVAAIFYAYHSFEKIHNQEVIAIPALIIFASTLIHGLTAYPLSKFYASLNKKPD